MLYIEACEAGSMFEGLMPTNIDVFVTTAANAEESSYATYCPGKEIKRMYAAYCPVKPAASSEPSRSP